MSIVGMNSGLEGVGLPIFGPVGGWKYQHEPPQGYAAATPTADKRRSEANTSAARIFLDGIVITRNKFHSKNHKRNNHKKAGNNNSALEPLREIIWVRDIFRNKHRKRIWLACSLAAHLQIRAWEQFPAAGLLQRANCAAPLIARKALRCRRFDFPEELAWRREVVDNHHEFAASSAHGIAKALSS